MSRLEESAERAALHLAQLDTVESVLADVRAERVDEAVLQAIIDVVAAAQRADGSWLGSLLETSLSLLLLHELRAERNLVIDRAIEWISGRCNAPGRFADTCEPATHDLGLCSHFISDFFSAAPASVDLSGLQLRGSAVIGSDRDARIAVSALACEALLTWGERGHSLDVHVDGVTRIMQHAISGRFELSTTALLCGTRLLCATGLYRAASEGDAVTATRNAALEFVARSQRGDGSWRGADLFVVLDALAMSCRMGMAPPAVIVALRHAADMLFLMQQRDGSWGRQTGPSQMLSGLSALRALQPQRESRFDQRLPQRTPIESSPPIIP